MGKLLTLAAMMGIPGMVGQGVKALRRRLARQAKDSYGIRDDTP